MNLPHRSAQIFVLRVGKPYNIKPGRISQYEQGLFEPNLLVLVAYARLAKVHLEFVIDDRFTLQELRKQLGKHSS